MSALTARHEVAAQHDTEVRMKATKSLERMFRSDDTPVWPEYSNEVWPGGVSGDSAPSADSIDAAINGRAGRVALQERAAVVIL